MILCDREGITTDRFVLSVNPDYIVLMIGASYRECSCVATDVPNLTCETERPLRKWCGRGDMAAELLQL